MKKCMFLFLGILSFTSALFAAPAREVKTDFLQNDATHFSATQRGDEYLHWLEDDKGVVIIYNPNTKNYDFAMIEGDALKTSGQVYNKKSRYQRSNTLDIKSLWKKTTFKSLTATPS